MKTDVHNKDFALRLTGFEVEAEVNSEMVVVTRSVETTVVMTQNMQMCPSLT